LRSPAEDDAFHEIYCAGQSCAQNSPAAGKLPANLEIRALQEDSGTKSLNCYGPTKREWLAATGTKGMVFLSSSFWDLFMPEACSVTDPAN
jgi:hypothetical protein